MADDDGRIDHRIRRVTRGVEVDAPRQVQQLERQMEAAARPAVRPIAEPFARVLQRQGRVPNPAPGTAATATLPQRPAHGVRSPQALAARLRVVIKA